MPASCRVSEAKVESVSSDCMVVVTQQLHRKFSFAVLLASPLHFVRYERLPAGRQGKPVGKCSAHELLVFMLGFSKTPRSLS